jgi:putative oxidoreductase
MEQRNTQGQMLFRTSPDDRSLLPRIVVGIVFLTEGIQKFLFPELLGPGRFAKIGFADPEFWAYFTATFEILCSALILLGFLVRAASVPLIVIMVVAFITTKWPMLMGKGFWPAMHEYRTDFAMTLLLIYLIIYGSSKSSLDWILGQKKIKT